MRFTTNIGFTKNSPKEPTLLPRNIQFILLTLAPAYFLLWGLLLQPFPEALRGLCSIIIEPDVLITDYIIIGGIGAALINASLTTIMCIVIIYFLKMDISGHTIAALSLMFGFSLFGKNVFNIWFILLGVYIYARYHKTHLSNYIYIGMYGTSLSPIITQTMLLGNLPLPLKFLLSLLVGSIIGFVLPPLCAHLFNIHKGYSLYNAGFAAGIIATIIISLYKSFGIPLETRKLWATGYNTLFLQILLSFFAFLIIIGIVADHDVFRKYLNILKYPGLGGTDFTALEGFCPTLVNIGVNGIFSTLFVVAVGAELNGPSIGGIFTIVGFSAAGKHLRNIAPIMFGVTLSSFCGPWAITEPAPVLALLFSTTLAPIAGQYGVIIGLLAGFIHAAVALNVGIVYSGLNLYNNGFAGGVVATFLIPIIESFLDRRAKTKGIL